MTDKLREAAQLALEALEYYERRNIEWEYADKHAITALRAALAQQDAQEPECNHKFVVDAASSISVCIHCGSPERIKKRDEWRQYLKDGETPFERFMRERKDLDALMTLYQSALQENERFKAQQDAAVANEWPAPLSEFKEGQWWVSELDAIARSGNATHEQKRAVSVVHHFLASAEKAVATPPAQRVELTEEEIDELWFKHASSVTYTHDFARAIIEAYERKNGVKP